MTPQHLATILRDSGAISSESVYAAFAAIRREAFAPKFWVRAADGVRSCLTHSDDHDANEAWLKAVYEDNSLVTHLDKHGVAVSSSSQPTVMARMLDAIDAAPGHQVLEIGTGTGYNAALLCHLVGDTNVFSVDIDPEVVETARERLKSEGYQPRLAAGDGRTAQIGGPWDRLIATCGVRTVPPEWIRQCKPGAIMVLNIGYALARLEVSSDRTATGHFVAGYSAFMFARDAANAADPGLRIDTTALTSLRSYTEQIPTQIHSEAFQVILSLLAPNLTHLRLGPNRSAFAHVDGTRLLAEHDLLRGDLNVWDEVIAAYHRWSNWGFPNLHDMTVALTTEGHLDLQPRQAAEPKPV
ncbi:methyltransferase domain-containing protein [Natronoglycomyces albus]|uniref:Protein-L-isoaspartate O-methyltransferase n=1 Tax=Natronoglycomyces albus TaxID=2811108 RepID=A0A895Y063_9ACTN|nr:methyltransferase domain-containing protein [Natronoglycomyces albus]QSB07198.1 methyltransferase domain-containing protein [Natronoglycomyces albus]